MATTIDYIEFICEQLTPYGKVHYKKMFGEYMVYIEDRPLLIVTDNTVYAKCLDSLKELMKNNETGYPYQGAKLHYILDVEDKEITGQVITALQAVPQKKPRNKH